jgi:hypothetical protein
MLSTIFVFLSIGTVPQDGSAAVALSACAILSGWMARDASRYNAADFPRLLDYWHHALMCSRCGAVFVPA